MPKVKWWNEFYAAERASLGAGYCDTLIADAHATLPQTGTLIFPHTRLAISGALTASVARAIIESGRDTVLAIGVLHGQPRDEALRGIHGEGAPHSKEIWKDEFSLDNFESLLASAALVLGKPMPRLITRYPLMTGAEPESLSGFDELRQLITDGAALVATADMIHHGIGYETPATEQRAMDNPNSATWARTTIERTLTSLANRDYSTFIAQSQDARSDFRDAGPVVRALLPAGVSAKVHRVVLVDYAETLQAARPTWVAAALAELS